MSGARRPMDVNLASGKKHWTRDEIETRKRSEASVPKPARLVCPKWLCPEAAKLFRSYARELLASGLPVSRLDSGSLARLCDAEALYAKTADLRDLALEKLRRGASSGHRNDTDAASGGISGHRSASDTANDDVSGCRESADTSGCDAPKLQVAAGAGEPLTSGGEPPDGFHMGLPAGGDSAEDSEQVQAEFTLWMKTMASCEKIARGAANDLGCTISSRCRMVVPKLDTEEDDPLLKLLERRNA